MRISFLIAQFKNECPPALQTSLPEPKLQFGEEHAHLFLVADGMGGHRAGERRAPSPWSRSSSSRSIRSSGSLKTIYARATRLPRRFQVRGQRSRRPHSRRRRSILILPAWDWAASTVLRQPDSAFTDVFQAVDEHYWSIRRDAAWPLCQGVPTCRVVRRTIVVPGTALWLLLCRISQRLLVREGFSLGVDGRASGWAA